MIYNLGFLDYNISRKKIHSRHYNIRKTHMPKSERKSNMSVKMVTECKNVAKP